jgi:hypothetical protein
LPVRPLLFAIWVGGDRVLWSAQRRMARDHPDPALPSLKPRWIRPRSIRLDTRFQV